VLASPIFGYSIYRTSLKLTFSLYKPHAVSPTGWGKIAICCSLRSQKGMSIYVGGKASLLTMVGRMKDAWCFRPAALPGLCG